MSRSMDMTNNNVSQIGTTIDLDLKTGTKRKLLRQ